MTGVVVWPYPIRIVAERLPEEDRPGLIALRWVRPNPVRRVLAQMRYPTPFGISGVECIADGGGRGLVAFRWNELDEQGGMLCGSLTSVPGDGEPILPFGEVLRLASDRKYPYDPQREAEDLLATLITGTGAVPVADRLIASLDQE